MKHFAASLLLVTVLSAGAASAQSVKGTCLPNDATSQRIVQYFQRMVTPTDPASTKLRDDLGLTSVTAAQVTSVTDEKVCAKGAKALDKLSDGKQPATVAGSPVYVVQVGDALAVVDPNAKAGEWTPAVLFDAHWKLRRVLLAF